MFDEPRFIAVSSGLIAQQVFKRCQWADPSEQFNQDAPCNAGEMQPCKPVKRQYQQAARDNKQDKRGMQEKDQVCQEIDNQLSLLCPPSENLSTR